MDSPGGIGFGCEGVMQSMSTSLRRTESMSMAEKYAQDYEFVSQCSPLSMNSIQCKRTCGRSSMPICCENIALVQRFAI